MSFSQMFPKNGTEPAMLTKLLVHVLKNEIPEAQAIIEAEPSLLLKSGEVLFNPEYQLCVRGTAFQLAASAHYLDMCRMLAICLDKHYPEQKSNQYQVLQSNNEAHKKPIHENEKARQMLTSILLENITQSEAIKEYHAYVLPESKSVLGYPFNIKLLADAYECYYIYVSQQETTNKFYEENVIQYLKQLLPIGYQKALRDYENTLILDTNKRAIWIADYLIALIEKNQLAVENIIEPIEESQEVFLPAEPEKNRCAIL